MLSIPFFSWNQSLLVLARRSFPAIGKQQLNRLQMDQRFPILLEESQDEAFILSSNLVLNCPFVEDQALSGTKLSFPELIQEIAQGGQSGQGRTITAFRICILSFLDPVKFAKAVEAEFIRVKLEELVLHLARQKQASKKIIGIALLLAMPDQHWGNSSVGRIEHFLKLPFQNISGERIDIGAYCILLKSLLVRQNLDAKNRFEFNTLNKDVVRSALSQLARGNLCKDDNISIRLMFLIWYSIAKPDEFRNALQEMTEAEVQSIYEFLLSYLVNRNGKINSKYIILRFLAIISNQHVFKLSGPQIDSIIETLFQMLNSIEKNEIHQQYSLDLQCHLASLVVQLILLHSTNQVSERLKNDNAIVSRSVAFLISCLEKDFIMSPPAVLLLLSLLNISIEFSSSTSLKKKILNLVVSEKRILIILRESLMFPSNREMLSVGLALMKKIWELSLDNEDFFSWWLSSGKNDLRHLDQILNLDISIKGESQGPLLQNKSDSEIVRQLAERIQNLENSNQFIMSERNKLSEKNVQLSLSVAELTDALESVSEDKKTLEHEAFSMHQKLQEYGQKIADNEILVADRDTELNLRYEQLMRLVEIHENLVKSHNLIHKDFSELQKLDQVNRIEKKDLENQVSLFRQQLKSLRDTNSRLSGEILLYKTSMDERDEILRKKDLELKNTELQFSKMRSTNSTLEKLIKQKNEELSSLRAKVVQFEKIAALFSKIRNSQDENNEVLCSQDEIFEILRSSQFSG